MGSKLSANARDNHNDRDDGYVLPAGLNVTATGAKFKKTLTAQNSLTKHNERGKTITKEGPLWVAPSVDIWGDVRLERDVSIWFQSVLRGDVNFIRVGERSNVQDGTIIHVSNHYPCVIGMEVTVGHRAVLHACTVEDLVLVGMGAIVLTGAVLGRGSVIAAGAVVKENEVVPPFTLMAGVPARKIRSLVPEATLSDHKRWAEKYVRLANAYVA